MPHDSLITTFQLKLLFIGWKCCKPRVLTFDEFLEIPPCTTGKHSTVDDTPTPAPKEQAPPSPPLRPVAIDNRLEPPPKAVAPVKVPSPAPSPAPPPEPESDDPSVPVPNGASCKRRGCNASYSGNGSRDDETCVHHPGQPIFHEGSKGWSCCKRRVLEFDEFMKLAGCTTKNRHLFLGKGKPSGEEKLENIR